MNPQNLHPFHLGKHEQQRYDAHVYLLGPVTRRYRRFCRPEEFDELVQAARLALVRACQIASEKPITTFPAFSHHLMIQGCRNFIFGRSHPAAIRHAHFHEVSLADELGVGEEGSYTRQDAVENSIGQRELQSNVAHDNLQSRLHDIRAAIAELSTLTTFERHVLRLRFLDGFYREAIAQRCHCSVAHVRRTVHSAVLKLRENFPGALPPDAPLPRDGNPAGCPR
jgi:RNA polymerase sigma factor (sigma-70 family)